MGLRKAHKQFIDYLQSTCMLSEATLRNHRNIFELLLRRYPRLTPDMIDVDLMTEYFRWLGTRQRKVGRDSHATGIKKGTVATYWKKLDRFFAWLCAKRILTANPLRAEGMQCPRVYYEDKQFLDRPDMEKIMSALSFKIRWKNALLKTRNLAIISVAANCGLRRGELLALQLSDINLVNNEIKVQGATSKSRSSRTIPLNSRVRRDLEAYIKERERAAHKTEFLWISDRYDGRLTVDGLRRVVSIVAEKADVKFHLHQLRHTFAVNFLHNSGLNSFKLQRLLGHRSIVSTAIYTRCLPVKTVRADVERLGDLENTL